jgi:hypothetical protein
MAWIQGAIQGVKGFAGAASRRNEGKINKKILERNAELARIAKVDALRRGGVRETIQRIKTAKIIGKQRAAAGASGVSVESGSTVDVMADARMMGELDSLIIRNNAAREAWGFEAQALNFDYQQGVLQYKQDQGIFTSMLTSAAMGFSGNTFRGGGGGGGNPYSGSSATSAAGFGSEGQWKGGPPVYGMGI